MSKYSITGSDFHKSKEWQRIRKEYLQYVGEPYHCVNCNAGPLSGSGITVDHIIPGHLGNGEYYYDNSFENLAVMCIRCNSTKKDKIKVTKQRLEWQSEKWY